MLKAKPKKPAKKLKCQPNRACVKQPANSLPDLRDNCSGCDEQGKDMAIKQKPKRRVPKAEWPNGKHPGGRPTTYRPEICQELIDWFDQDPWEEVNGKKQARRLPTFIAFAREKKIALATIYNWINPKHASYQPEFLETFEKLAKDAQKEALIQNALLGLYNPFFSKFVAVNISDMRDKHDVDLMDNRMVQLILESLPPDVAEGVRAAIKAKGKK